MAQEQQIQKIIAEYIWVDDPKNVLLKSKTCTLILQGKDLHVPNEKTEDGHILVPKSIYNNPFRGGGNRLILCEMFKNGNTPTETNTRNKAFETINGELGLQFAIVQDFTITSENDNLMKVDSGYPGVGYVHHREMMRTFYEYCLFAGVNLSSSFPTKIPYQWRVRLGYTGRVESADDLWVARYLLLRLMEKNNLKVNFSPKPFYNTPYLSKCIVYYNTEGMRKEGKAGYIDMDSDVDPYTEFLKLYKAAKRQMEQELSSKTVRETNEVE